ncbi:MAG TPA: CHAT domain-containing tetratricopeptide repeat protein [Acidobacteriaceae bacterium]|nr:CHAT domain-containing tetratricopeptide repeat protein [Acidobacteriaceae bacterium]
MGSPGVAASDDSPLAKLVITPGSAAVEKEIPPGTSLRFTILVRAGTTVVTTLTEIQQTSTVTWTDGAGRAHTPRTNLAGKNAQIRLTLPGSETPQSFVIVGASKRKAAIVRIVAGVPHPEEANERIAERGEEALAEADSLWAKHDPGNAKEALAAYDQAASTWETINDIAMLRRTLTWKAIYLAFTMGQPEQGRAVILRAVALPDAHDPVEQANAWKSAGFIQTDLADYSEGWQDYSNALRLFAEAGDSFNQEVLLENRGKLLQMTGDYEGALQDEDDAIVKGQELQDQVGMLHTEDVIGSIDLLQGRMQAAFAAYSRVLQLEQINAADVMIGFAETDLASLYQQLGAAAQSQDMQGRAEAFWTKHPYLLGQLATMIQRAKLEEDAGQLSASFGTYTRTLQLAESAGMKREKVFVLLGLGTTSSKLGKFTDARNYFAQANQLAAEIQETDALAQIATAEGDLEVRAGKLPVARADYQKAVEIARRSFDHPGLISALGGLAHAEFKSGDDLSALKDIDGALDGIESARDSTPPNSLRTGYFSSWHSYYALAIDVLMHLNALHPDSGYDRQALVIAERGRARFLLDQMEESGSRESNGGGDLPAQQAESLRRIHLAESSLAAMRTGHPHSAAVARLESEVARLMEQEDRLEAEMSRSGGESLSGSADLFHAPGKLIGELQRSLGAGTAALEYWINEDAGYLWVVTADSVHAYQLPGTDKLSPLARQLTHDLTAPFITESPGPEALAAALSDSASQFNQAAQQLGRWLVPPGALPHSVHTLLIVGDGAVLSMPMGALRLSGGNGRRSVQDQYAVVQEPSMAALLSLLERRQPSRSAEIAVIADPVFNADDPRVAAGVRAAQAEPKDAAESFWSQATTAGHLTRLNYAGQEVGAIEAAAGASHVHPEVGFVASAEHVRSQDWSRFEVVHFATHAFLNPVQPDLSNIMLSRLDAAGHPQAGALWFSDIASMRMPVDLVVLSACQTANGEELPGEGLVGLSYSFLIAGSRRVIGSLWDVDDAATAELMRRFYQALYQEKESPAEALRSAQRAIAKVPRWSNPYYWAGFTIEGDPHPLPR